MASGKIKLNAIMNRKQRHDFLSEIENYNIQPG